MPGEPKCSQAPCQLGGGCGPGQSACSLNEFNFTSVCPYARRGKREAQTFDDGMGYGGEIGYVSMFIIRN